MQSVEIQNFITKLKEERELTSTLIDQHIDANNAALAVECEGRFGIIENAIKVLTELYNYNRVW